MPAFSVLNQPACRLCGSTKVFKVTDVLKRPGRENDFQIPEADYQRSVYRCQSCDVFFNHHRFIPSDFYSGTYNQAVYGRKLLEKYKQIMALPPEKSDNRHRVKRIHDFLSAEGRVPSRTRVLDVGTGLCVFLGALKERGYLTFALDPDPEAIRHAVEQVRVQGGFASSMEAFQTSERFDLITFNKVLEHIEDPVSVLKKAKSLLAPGGIIYIELPDGDEAFKNGGAIEREEFFIEHFTVYSERSMKYLAEKSGCSEVTSAKLHEPSDKYTLYGFYKPAD